MKISIVTTCFNSAATIAATIESILSQQGKFELEYIITDAGSTDGTLDIIQSYGDRINLIDATGLNQSKGINLGLRHSTGDIVAFLNADDIYYFGTLDKVCRSFAANPHRRWLIGQCKIIDEHGQELHSFVSAYKNTLLRAFSYSTLLVENYICQPAVFLRRDILNEYGFFSENENLVMDYEYWLRIAARERPLIVHSALAGFRRMQGTKSNSAFRQQFKDDMRVARRYALENRMAWTTPLKYLSNLKTVAMYNFMYR